MKVGMLLSLIDNLGGSVMNEKIDIILDEIKALCKSNSIEVTNKYEECIKSNVLIFRKNDRKMAFEIREGMLRFLPCEYIIADINQQINDKLLIPNAPEEVFDKVMEEIKTLCDDNGIYLKYYYSDDHNICTFRFSKFGKTFRYSISSTDILYKNVRNYEIHDRMIKMYDAARNEIG
jgi:hypothetical protein